MTTVVPTESIVSKIVLLRGEKVLLDRDLAELYGVETGMLNRAVKRNFERFPKDFMFQLSMEESELLRCQTGISKAGRGGRRYLPYAFTERQMLRSAPHSFNYDATVIQPSQQRPSNCSAVCHLSSDL